MRSTNYSQKKRVSRKTLRKRGRKSLRLVSRKTLRGGRKSLRRKSSRRVSRKTLRGGSSSSSNSKCKIAGDFLKDNQPEGQLNYRPNGSSGDYALEEEIKEVAKAFLTKNLNTVVRKAPKSPKSQMFESNTQPENIGKSNIEFTTNEIYKAWMNRQICINSKQTVGWFDIDKEAEENSFVDELKKMTLPDGSKKPELRIFFTSNRTKRLDDVLKDLYDNLKNFWDKKGDLGEGQNLAENVNPTNMKSYSMWEGEENKKRRTIFGMDKINRFFGKYDFKPYQPNIKNLYNVYINVPTHILFNKLFPDHQASRATDSELMQHNIKHDELISVSDLLKHIIIHLKIPNKEIFLNYLYGVKA